MRKRLCECECVEKEKVNPYWERHRNHFESVQHEWLYDKYQVDLKHRDDSKLQTYFFTSKDEPYVLKHKKMIVYVYTYRKFTPVGHYMYFSTEVDVEFSDKIISAKQLGACLAIINNIERVNLYE